MPATLRDLTDRKDTLTVNDQPAAPVLADARDAVTAIDAAVDDCFGDVVDRVVVGVTAPDRVVMAVDVEPVLVAGLPCQGFEHAAPVASTLVNAALSALSDRLCREHGVDRGVADAAVMQVVRGGRTAREAASGSGWRPGRLAAAV